MEDWALIRGLAAEGVPKAQIAARLWITSGRTEQSFSKSAFVQHTLPALLLGVTESAAGKASLPLNDLPPRPNARPIATTRLGRATASSMVRRR